MNLVFDLNTQEVCSETLSLVVPTQCFWLLVSTSLLLVEEFSQSDEQTQDILKARVGIPAIRDKASRDYQQNSGFESRTNINDAATIGLLGTGTTKNRLSECPFLRLRFRPHRGGIFTRALGKDIVMWHSMSYPTCSNVGKIFKPSPVLPLTGPSTRSLQVI